MIEKDSDFFTHLNFYTQLNWNFKRDIFIELFLLNNLI